MDEDRLFWLVLWDGHKHHVGPRRAASREAATQYGLEHYPGMTLGAVISDRDELTIPQMLDLAEVLPPPGSPMWRLPEGD